MARPDMDYYCFTMTTNIHRQAASSAAGHDNVTTQQSPTRQIHYHLEGDSSPSQHLHLL